MMIMAYLLRFTPVSSYLEWIACPYQTRHLDALQMITDSDFEIRS